MGMDVFLDAEELSELYCLKTFYSYYAPRKPPFVRLKFTDKYVADRESGVYSDILGYMPVSDDFCPSDFYVRAYSDITNDNSFRRRLDIDQLLLKNSVVPMSEEKKASLKEAYGVRTDKPITVMWHGRLFTADVERRCIDLAKAIERYSSVYFFDAEEEVCRAASGRDIHIIGGYGRLRDYFAMADMAIYGENLIHNEGAMHNFVEATEGGILFMIPSTFSQFGLEELTELGVVKQYQEYDELKEGMIEYAKSFNPASKAEHARKRAGHLRRCRMRYLPILAGILEDSLGIGGSFPESELLVYELNEDHRFYRRVLHPDTQWKPEDEDRLGRLISPKELAE